MTEAFEFLHGAVLLSVDELQPGSALGIYRCKVSSWICRVGSALLRYNTLRSKLMRGEGEGGDRGDQEEAKNRLPSIFQFVYYMQ